MSEKGPTVAITQLFAMQNKNGCTIQFLKGPEGQLLINAGDQANSIFVVGFWTKGDLKQFRNALSRELADG